MDPMYAQTLVDMGVSLTELAVKGTVSAVSKKVRAAKEIKEVQEVEVEDDDFMADDVDLSEYETKFETDTEIE